MSKEILVNKQAGLRFAVQCLERAGSKLSHAQVLASALVEADYRGHYSHGLNRLGMYCGDLQNKMTSCDGDPVVEKEMAGTALVNGNNLLGPVVGKFCMEEAINKAKNVGVGCVVARNSNHYGIAGFYSTMALQHNMIGMSATNTSPLVVPTRAEDRTFGTNPLTLAAPAAITAQTKARLGLGITNSTTTTTAPNPSAPVSSSSPTVTPSTTPPTTVPTTCSSDSAAADSFVLDMATSAVAVGKIEIASRRGESIPRGWGVDKNGQVSTDPDEVWPHGGLLPLGGEEATSGYKGYGLAFMVEILCGILSGAKYGPHIRPWMSDEPTHTADLGQFFMAINIDAFAPGFQGRLSDLMNYCRNLPRSGEDPVLVAGDPERIHMAQCDREGGIRYHPNQITHLNELAAKYDVEPLSVGSDAFQLSKSGQTSSNTS